MVEPISVLGVVFGGIAVIIAGYSRYKQKIVERQMDRKRELRIIAGTLEDINRSFEGLIDLLNNPLSDEDLKNQLEMCAKDVLSVHHRTGSHCRVCLNRFQRGTGDDSTLISRPEQVIDGLRNNEFMFVSLIIEEAEGELPEYMCGEIFYQLRYACTDHRQLGSDEIHLIDQFNANLASDIEEMINQIAMKVTDEILDKEEGIDIDPSNYESIQEMAEIVYSYFFNYDGWSEDVRDLVELEERVENVRTSMIQTSYS